MQNPLPAQNKSPKPAKIHTPKKLTTQNHPTHTIRHTLTTNSPPPNIRNLQKPQQKPPATTHKNIPPLNSKPTTCIIRIATSLFRRSHVP